MAIEQGRLWVLIGTGLVLAIVLPVAIGVSLLATKDDRPPAPEEREAIPPGKTELIAGPAVGIEIGESWFPMGCLAGDTECQENEAPARNVRLDAYRIDRTEVTVERYALCVKAGGCTPPKDGPGCNYGVAGRDAHPINCVSETQARSFCEWDGKRLPSEAEWERAAKGDRGRRFPWGEPPPSCERAVMAWNGPGCGGGTTAPVCSRPAGNSAEGLCDLAGNVWEFTNDAYRYAFFEEAGTDNPKIPAFHEARGLRGGSYLEAGTAAFRASNRQERNESIPPSAIGFRCARPLEGWDWNEE